MNKYMHMCTSMYMSMCHLYIYTPTYVYPYIYIYMYTCIYTSKYVYLGIYMYIDLSIYSVATRRRKILFDGITPLLELPLKPSNREAGPPKDLGIPIISV